MMGRTIFIDPGRCIGCRACVSACRECDSHKRGQVDGPVDYIDRGHSPSPPSRPSACTARTRSRPAPRSARPTRS